MSETLRSSEIIYLPRKPVPFIEPFLKAELKNHGVFFNSYDLIDYQFNRFYIKIATSYLLSLAVREAGDNTGILAPLIGVSRSKKETKDIVQKLGEGLLRDLDSSGIKNSVLSALDAKNHPGFNPDLEKTIITIDRFAGRAVQGIKSMATIYGLNIPDKDNMTNEAYTFRSNNETILEDLINRRGGNIIELFQQKFAFDSNGYLTEFTQAPIIPVIDASPLLAILPNELNRNISAEAPPANDPLGFVARLNMAGSDILRYLINIAVNKKEVQELADHYI